MYKVGVDLGGTNIVAGVVDENLRVIAKGKVKTNSPRPANEIADDMAKACFIACENADLDTGASPAEKDTIIKYISFCK